MVGLKYTTFNWAIRNAGNCNGLCWAIFIYTDFWLLDLSSGLWVVYYLTENLAIKLLGKKEMCFLYEANRMGFYFQTLTVPLYWDAAQDFAAHWEIKKEAVSQSVRLTRACRKTVVNLFHNLSQIIVTVSTLMEKLIWGHTQNTLNRLSIRALSIIPQRCVCVCLYLWAQPVLLYPDGESQKMTCHLTQARKRDRHCLKST